MSMLGLSYPAVLAATAHCYLPVYYKLQARYTYLHPSLHSIAD